MNHRIGRVVFVIVFSLAVAWYAYQWITDPSGRTERAVQERVVAVARERVGEAVQLSGLEFVDPLAPQRRVGKVYVYRRDDGWEVSGFYRRDKDDRWHPWLLLLDAGLQRQHLKVQDPGLSAGLAEDPALEITP